MAAIDVIAAGYEKGVAHGYREESRRFGELAMTDVSRQLIFLFFATNELKKDPGVEPSQYPDLPVSAFEPLPVEKIAIIGAGFMGAGIASIADNARQSRSTQGRRSRPRGKRLRRGS